MPLKSGQKKRKNLKEASKGQTKKALKAAEVLRVKRVKIDREQIHNSDNPTVRCACGRTTQADMMLDVSDLDDELTGGEDYVCDGCWTRWKRTKRMID